VLIVALTCLTTAVTALFCSSIFQKTATSLISTYLIIVTMFFAPVAIKFFAETFFQGTSQAAVADKFGIMSPFSATFSLPLNIVDENHPTSGTVPPADLSVFFGYIAWTLLYNGLLILGMMRLFQVRWRVAD